MSSKPHTPTDLAAMFLFLAAAAASLYAPSPVNIASFFLILALSARAAWHLHAPMRLHELGMAFIAILYYAFRFTRINNLELWIDEANILVGRLYTFDQATGMAAGHHIVPPLNYWFVWLFRNPITAVPPEIMEFTYRIPSMIFHILAGILLARAADHAVPAHVPYRRLTSVLAFMTYVFQPLLFSYSLDLRFYSFMNLGIVLTIYLFIAGKLYDLRLLPLVFLFCLNSAPHLLVLFPLAVYALIMRHKTHDGSLSVWPLAYALMAIIVFPVLNTHSEYGNPYPSMYIQAVTYVFFHPSIPVTMLVAFAAGMFAGPRIVVLTLSLAVYMLAITAYTVATHYFDLGARHYMFMLPPVILLIIALAKRHVTRRGAPVALTLVLLFVTVPWIMQTERVLAQRLPHIRTVFGVKETMRLEGSKTSVILLVDPKLEPYTSSFIWYAQRYGVSLRTVTDQSRACVQLTREPHSILTSLHYELPCEGYGFASRYNTFGIPIVSATPL